MPAAQQHSYVEIPLRNRAGVLVGTALVSPEDASLAEHRWCLRPDGYVVRRANGRILRLSRAVAGLAHGDKRQADHENLDPLDNRRDNIVVVDGPAQNCQNRKPMGATSRYRGVYWDKTKGKWAARATVKYRAHYLGRFDSEVLAGAVAAQFRSDNMPFSAEGRAAA